MRKRRKARPAGATANRAKPNEKLLPSQKDITRNPRGNNPPAKFKRGYRGRVRLYLHDEAPRLGCGWRTFNICVGNKHVKLNDPNGGRSRISRPLFDRLSEASSANSHRNSIHGGIQ